jgi:hypothetical protein
VVKTDDELKNEIARLKELCAERKKILPAHSVRPHQLLEIEELEEEIARKEKELMERTSEESNKKG